MNGMSSLDQFVDQVYPYETRSTGNKNLTPSSHIFSSPGSPNFPIKKFLSLFLQITLVVHHSESFLLSGRILEKTLR
jgi:hypothetical protein